MPNELLRQVCVLWIVVSGGKCKNGWGDWPLTEVSSYLCSDKIQKQCCGNSWLEPLCFSFSGSWFLFPLSRCLPHCQIPCCLSSWLILVFLLLVLVLGMLGVLQSMELRVWGLWTREEGGDSLLVSGSYVCVNSSAMEGNLYETCWHTCNFCLAALIYLKVFFFAFVCFGFFFFF